MNATLNPAQESAAAHRRGPLLVLAGAGTGKTRVLTARIARLIRDDGVYPSRIVAVTFTNKAAREIADRLVPLIGETSVSEMRNLGTFHSVAAKILRRHGDAVGLSRNFAVFDDSDREKLLKSLLFEMNIDLKRYPVPRVEALIEKCRNSALTSEHLRNGGSGSEAGAVDGRFHEIYARYEQRLQAVDAVDFGGLILQALQVMRIPEIGDMLRARFRHVLADEYQDTNTAQYLLLREMSATSDSLFCVGDEDQAIYTWRGADPQHILRFEHDFPGCDIVRLERNYRSTGHILAAAATVIANNTLRLGKTLYTEDEAGVPPSIHAMHDDREEAAFIAAGARRRRAEGVPATEIAVLVRSAAQMRMLEEAFGTVGQPYRIIGGMGFYERAEIRDALAYLRLSVRSGDDPAFERAIGVPKRGIGDVALNKLRQKAREDGTSLFAAAAVPGILRGKAAEGLAAFMSVIVRAQEALAHVPTREILETLLNDSGYLQMLKAEGTIESEARLENLAELLRAASEVSGPAMFLEYAVPVSVRDDTDDHLKIRLMTLHAAKGTEFDTVFLPGWEEELFPHKRVVEERGEEGIEEERRLAYVGITRARKRLFITHALRRRLYHTISANPPSRFLAELPRDRVRMFEPMQDTAAAKRAAARTEGGGYRRNAWA